MDGLRRIYYAIHAISLLKMINSDINYMNLCFGMGAINSVEQLRWRCQMLFLKFDWNPESCTVLRLLHTRQYRYWSK